MYVSWNILSQVMSALDCFFQMKFTSQPVSFSSVGPCVAPRKHNELLVPLQRKPDPEPEPEPEPEGSKRDLPKWKAEHLSFISYLHFG